MLRSNAVKRLLNHPRPKNTDDLGLCGIVYKVPKPVDPKQVRVIEVAE